MAIRSITIEAKCCDICGTEGAITSCMRCKRDFCWEHREHVKTYPHSLWFSGSGDGKFCIDCDKFLCSIDGCDDPLYELHYAYLEIGRLRESEKAFHERLKVSAEKAADSVQQLLKLSFPNK